MPHAGLSAAVARTRRAVAASAPSDGRLLADFLTARDGAAFAELVARFGPMVFAVCRRLTGHHQDAEDAFQAAFVVLARKAAAVVPREAVGAWLHGVAVRTALEARAVAAKRLARETPTDRLPDLARTDPDADDRSAVLHQELAELPEKFRTLLVLCDLRGEPQTEVAARLGVPVGTVYSRLAAARQALAGRLRKRGVALSAAGLTVALAETGQAAVPGDLPARAVAAAVSAGPVPTAVAALSHGVLRAMFLQKLKLPALTLALVAAGVIASSVLAAPRSETPTAPADPPKPAAKAAEPTPLPKGPNKLLFYRAGHLTLIDPDGKNEKKVSQDRDKFHPGDARLSPDGKKLAVMHQTERNPDGPPRRKLYVRGIEDKEPGTDLGVECQMFFWSPDGTEIAYSDFVDGTDRKLEAAHGIVNVATREKAALKIPDGHVITDWSRDGKLFLTTSIDGVVTQEKFPTAKLHLMNRDGTEHKALTDGKKPAVFGRLSPDGKRVLFMQMELKEETPEEKKARQDAGGRPPRPERVLAVLDVASGKTTKVEEVPLNAELQGYCWSPDGKRIAYAWREVHEGKPEDVQDKETESFLVVCDPDGKNAKTITTEKGPGQWVITLGYIDWR